MITLKQVLLLIILLPLLPTVFMPQSVHWSCMCCISDPFDLKLCSFSVLCACKSGLAQPQAKTPAVFIVNRNVPREESKVKCCHLTLSV